MKSKLFILFIITLSLFLVSCNSDAQDLINDVNDQIKVQKEFEENMMKDSVVIDDKMMELTDETNALIGSVSYDSVATLKDVSGGDGTGVVKSVYDGDKYILKVDLKFLPELQGTDFYEGWIVRKGVFFSVISTGRAIEAGDNEYVNNYVSKENLKDHAFYVLTLEPDDGNPAPAEHILEGTLEGIIE